MDICPFGRALAAVLASWERTSDLREKDFKKPAIASQSRVFCFLTKRKENMNKNKNKQFVPTEFGPETRFELRATPPAPFRATQETEFERLKNKLLAAAVGAGHAGAECSAAARGQRRGGAGLGDRVPLAGVPGAVRGKNRGRRAPRPSGRRASTPTASSSPHENATADNVTGDKWQVTALFMSPVTCHSSLLWGIFGARTVPRRGVSSIRLRRHCPRSYAIL